VDIQGDFTVCKNGALAVPGTDKDFIEKVEKATKILKKKGSAVFATQDWHPPNHVSFFTNHNGKRPFDTVGINEKSKVLWPPHCVQGTKNAKILLDGNLLSAVVKKGKNPNYDSYSGFQDDGGEKTELASLLRKNGIKRLVVYGLATDYCVKATAMDAVDEGFKVAVIESLCKGVSPDTASEALQEMKSKGITVLKGLDIDSLFKKFP